MVENFLKNNGFNDKDIKIYLDLYKHGQSFASSVSLRTGIDRTTVYSVIRRLLSKGVIAQTMVNDVSAYLPVSPEFFADRIDDSIRDLEAQKRMSLLFAEEMKKIARATFSKTKVKIYDGDESIKGLYKQTLAGTRQQKSFVNIDKIPDSMRAFLKGPFMKMKLKKSVRSKVIVPQSDRNVRYSQLDQGSNRETRVVKNLPFDLHSEIILFNGDEVALIDFHQRIYGIVISSETFYRTMEAIFDYVWETSSPS